MTTQTTDHSKSPDELTRTGHPETSSSITSKRTPARTSSIRRTRTPSRQTEAKHADNPSSSLMTALPSVIALISLALSILAFVAANQADQVILPAFADNALAESLRGQVEELQRSNDRIYTITLWAIGTILGLSIIILGVNFVRSDRAATNDRETVMFHIGEAKRGAITSSNAETRSLLDHYARLEAVNHDYQSLRLRVDSAEKNLAATRALVDRADSSILQLTLEYMQNYRRFDGILTNKRLHMIERDLRRLTPATMPSPDLQSFQIFIFPLDIVNAAAALKSKQLADQALRECLEYWVHYSPNSFDGALYEAIDSLPNDTDMILRKQVLEKLAAADPPSDPL